MSQTGYDPTSFSRAVVDVHGNYRSGRLGHEQPDEWISDTVTPRVLRPHLVRAGLFVVIYAIVAAFSVVVWFFAAVAALAAANNALQRGDDTSSSGSFVSGVSLLLILLQLLVFIAWIVSLFLPLREPIAEYGMLIEGRAGAAASAYAWIAQTVAARRTPFQIRAGKVQNVPVLLLTSGRVRAMVVVYGVGSDLYMGWTMWRSRSTATLIGNMLRDMVQGMGIRELNGDVRAAATRALRELVHSVLREGVQASILQPPVDEAIAQANLNQLPALDVPGVPTPPAPQMPAYAPPTYSPMPASAPTNFGYPAGYPTGQSTGYPAGYPASASAPPASAPPASGQPYQTGTIPQQPGPYGS